MPLTLGKALGVPAVVGLLSTVISCGLSFAVLAYLGQLLFPDLPGDEPLYVAAVASLFIASIGGALGGRVAFGLMQRQYERERAARFEI